MMMINIPTFFFGHNSVCTYCGDTPSSIDHIIPFQFQTSEERKGDRARFGPITPACASCNTKIGSRYFDTFDDRCKWIASSIERQAKPIIWSNAELKTIGYTLRTKILADIAKRRWARVRADWYQSRDYFLTIEPLSWIKEANEGPLAAFFAPSVEMIRIILYK
jgi:hypothetical protein